MHAWQGKSVLVTGGAGFIGSHLTRALVELGCKVRVADNLARGHLRNLQTVAKQIEFIKLDLTSAEACAQACAGVETVFHLASKVGGIGYYMKRPAEVYTNNILMDTQILIAAQAAQVQRFLFSSSAHVYPRSLQATVDSAPLKEQDAHPADPVISYGLAKLVTEKQIQYLHDEGTRMRSVIVRIVGAFGEDQDIGLDTASAIPAFCRRAIEFPKRTPFTMFGQGKETRSYCYVGDVVDGMILGMETLEHTSVIGPLNLGQEGRVTIAEVLRMVIEASGKDIHVEHLPAQESGIRGQAVDLTRTKEVLQGWSPKVTLREGILKTYRNIEERLKTGEV